MSDNDLNRVYDVPLSDKEGMLIGRIIALWGALESECLCKHLQLSTCKTSKSCQVQ